MRGSVRLVKHSWRFSTLCNLTLTSPLLQLLDEVKILLGDITSQNTFRAFPSALLTSDLPIFQEHLKSRSAEISSAISQLSARAAGSSPEISSLQGQIAQLLANEKGHITELEKSRLEQAQLLEQIEAASLRYMIAERKIDRAKSASVAKLERQATAGGRSDTGSGLGSSTENAVDGHNTSSKGTAESGDALFEAEKARKEAIAALSKQKEQYDMLEAENERLTSQVTTLTTQLSNLSDDDYSRTDLFKHLKSQHEDVIKRINHLEATNIQLREEAEKLQKERTAYRIEIENEFQMAIAEKEAHLMQTENDLARIRTARDELLADVTMRKAAQSQEKTSISQIKELASAREERVKALESEVERLCLQSGRSNSATSQPTAEDISPHDLHNRYTILEQQHSMLKEEVESMKKAYKKAVMSASQKIENLSALEERTTRLGAEKSKADQKYFAAMKAKEAREQEVRSLRASSSKSSEMVSTLKDAEAATRAAIINLDKEIAEYKTSHALISSQHSASQQQVMEQKIAIEGMKRQIEELKKSLASKDASTSVVSSAHRKAEVNIETLKVRLEETQKHLRSWKSKGLGNQSDEYEMLRVSLPVLPVRPEVSPPPSFSPICGKSDT